VLLVGFLLRKISQKLLRDEYFGGKRNTANGTSWKDTDYSFISPYAVWH